MPRAIPLTGAVPPLTPSRRAGAGIALVLAPGVCLIAFVAVVTRMLELDTDFPHHIRYAQQLAETGAIQPHFGYHAVVIVVQAFTPADWVAAAGIVTLGGVAACAAVVAWWLRGALSTSVPALLVAAALVPAAVCVLQPVLPLDPTRYDAVLFGYFPPNQWHSPTTLFSKPFALLLLGLGPAVVWSTRGARAGRTRILTSAALVVTSVLVKPNFIMAFLPALSVLAVLHWRRTDWRWFGLSFAVPAVAVLGLAVLRGLPAEPRRRRCDTGAPAGDRGSLVDGPRDARLAPYRLGAVSPDRGGLFSVRARRSPCAARLGHGSSSVRPSVICWQKVNGPAPGTSSGRASWRSSCCSLRQLWRYSGTPRPRVRGAAG